MNVKTEGYATEEDMEYSISVNPSELKSLELVWTVVLKTQNETVGQKAIDLLIKIHIAENF